MTGAEVIERAGAAEAPARLALGSGLTMLAAATWLMLKGVEPFATSYYLFAWYSTLLAADGAVALAGGVGERGRFFLLGRPRFLLTLLAWSAVAWLFFELLNFRLRNWYYVFVPAEPWLRWPSIVLSFATVLPAVLVSEALLARLGVARHARSAPFRLTPRRLAWIRFAGWAMLLLPLLWPRYFFPLVWGAVVLLLDPFVRRRDPARSLLGDLEAGRPGRILRLLAGGGAIGLLWEMFNIEARGKWIYTVPGFERFKLFEMPVLGFLGFPPFALECYVIWQTLVVAGLATPRRGPAVPRPRAARIGAAIAATAFAVGILAGMERWTISSVRPALAELEHLDIPAPRLLPLGLDAFDLANATPLSLARAVGAPPHEASEWIHTARLVTLRGIGTDNARLLRAAGVRSIDDLAAADPAALASRLAALAPGRITDARVRVWVRAARRIAGIPTATEAASSS